MTLIIKSIPCLHRKCRRQPARWIGVRSIIEFRERGNESAKAAAAMIKFIAESGESEVVSIESYPEVGHGLGRFRLCTFERTSCDIVRYIGLMNHPHALHNLPDIFSVYVLRSILIREMNCQKSREIRLVKMHVMKRGSNPQIHFQCSPPSNLAFLQCRK